MVQSTLMSQSRTTQSDERKQPAIGRRFRLGLIHWVALIAVASSVIPFLVTRVPGFVDMPSHMARHYIMALQDSHDPLLKYFSVSWKWIANLGVDIPTVLLTKWLGVDIATRVVAGAIAPLTIAGILALSKAAHGRITASAIVALPFAFHQAWMWGFLNYCLSAALALLVAAWVLSRPQRPLLEQFALALAALAVWTAHMAGWGILLVLAAGAELARLRKIRDVIPAIARNLPLFLPLVPLLAWRGQSTGPQVPLVYVDFLRTKITVFASVFRGTEKPLDLVLLGVTVVIGFLAIAWASKPRLERRLLAAGFLLVICTVLVPTTILNAWGTDLRLAPIAMMVLVIAIGPSDVPQRNKLICWAGAALFFVRVTSIAHQWAIQGPTLERKLTLLDAVPIGGKLGVIYVPPKCGFSWKLEPSNKLASYAVLRRHAFVNTLFMVDNARLVNVRSQRLDQLFRKSSPIVGPICPHWRPDLTAINKNMKEFENLGFDAVWISGVEPSKLPNFIGFSVVDVMGNDVILRAVK